MKNFILRINVLTFSYLLFIVSAGAQTYVITLESDPPDAAYSLQGAGSYNMGENVEVFAEGYEGWQFMNWTENGVVVSEQARYDFIITSSRDLVANFTSYVNFSSDPESLDFGDIPVGQCGFMEYLLINNPPVDKQIVELQIIAPEGYQTVHQASYPGFADYRDTTYHSFYMFYGEVFSVKFCPVEQREYSGTIINIHTSADTLFIPVTGTGVSPQNLLEVNLILEGAFLSEAQPLMHTILNDNSLLPNSQPFGPPLPYFGNSMPIWYYNGNETVLNMPAEVVDWVLVELRDAPSADGATPNTAVHQQAALLLNTGEIINTMGQPLYFDHEVQSNLFVVVYHRNHLGVMSSQPLAEINGTYSWDFTTGSSQAYGDGQKELANGVYGLPGGDGDGNGQIQQQDKNNVWLIQGGLSGYYPGDFNLDGQVQNQDKNNIWLPNSGTASQIPGGKQVLLSD